MTPIWQQWLADNVITIFTTILGGTSFVGYIIEKRKRKIEEKQLSADALKTMQEAYDKFTEDSLRRYQDLQMEFQIVKDELKSLKSEYAKLQIENEHLLRKNK